MYQRGIGCHAVLVMPQDDIEQKSNSHLFVLFQLQYDRLDERVSIQHYWHALHPHHEAMIL